MMIERISQLSGKRHQMELNVTPDQIAAFDRGTMVQDAFPHLSAPEREFILTGITPEEWSRAFPPDDDDN
jgi:exonuclease I